MVSFLWCGYSIVGTGKCQEHMLLLFLCFVMETVNAVFMVGVREVVLSISLQAPPSLTLSIYIYSGNKIFA